MIIATVLTGVVRPYAVLSHKLYIHKGGPYGTPRPGHFGLGDSRLPPVLSTGPGNPVLRKVDGRDRLWLRCCTCGEECSARRGTALCNTKLAEVPAKDIINHCDAGCSVRATSRLVTVCKETMACLLGGSGRHAQRFHAQHVQGLRPLALEFDEPWRFVKKSRSTVKNMKCLTPEDIWVHTAVAADSKLVVSLVVGKCI